MRILGYTDLADASWPRPPQPHGTNIVNLLTLMTPEKTAC